MTLFFADLVREFSSATGAGDFVLEGAVPGHRRFAGTVPAGARFHYSIAGVTRPAEWEVGEGELGSGGVLVRGPLASSAGGAPVAFGPGLKSVALTVGATWYAQQSAPAAPAPFVRAVMQHAVLGLGTAQAVPAGMFVTIAVAQAESHGGGFDDAAHVYTVPEAGLYDCQLKVKAVDAAAPGGSYGIGIDTANRDSASFAWGQLNASRNGIQNRVVRRLAAGDPLRAFLYSDTAIGLNGAELVVRKVGP